MISKDHQYLSWVRANILISSLRDKVLISERDKYPEEFRVMIEKLDTEVKAKIKRIVEE